tara:strand:- start:3156 stop:3842 length:687 start_codon:yes stop_codon:yes gene_type:complete
MKPIVIIPARGGSKGVPRKNIKKLNGKPLINYTIEAARAVFEDKHIIVSTDDKEIKKTVEGSGLQIPYLRPDFLASDTATTYDVLMHVIKFCEENNDFFDTLVLLQPTSPFRTATHIKEALKLYNSNLDMVVSVSLTKSNPYYVLFEEDDNGYLKKSKKGNYSRRQDVPKVYEYNGAVYIINIDALKKQNLSEFSKIIKYEMDEISSLDIDTELDWRMAELLINLNKV